MIEKHPFYIPNHSFKKSQFLSRVPVSTLIFGVSAALFLDMIVTAKFASFFGFIIALIGTVIIGFYPESIKFLNCTQRWGRRYKISLPLLVFCAVVTVLFLDYTSAPAQAQFFNQTESWLRSSFPINGGAGGGGTDIYKLVFNTLRAIFVLYLAVALVRVIAAARNDEDWQTLARTPLIILITVTLGDILAALITGGGTGGGANP